MFDAPSIDSPSYRQFLEALGVAVYTTDADGRITFYNQAAIDLWGRDPGVGEMWCGSWKLFWPNGDPMAHGECPMAIALKERRSVRGYRGRRGAARRDARVVRPLPDRGDGRERPDDRRDQRPGRRHRPAPSRGWPSSGNRGEGRVPRPGVPRASDAGHDYPRECQAPRGAATSPSHRAHARRYRERGRAPAGRRREPASADTRRQRAGRSTSSPRSWVSASADRRCSPGATTGREIRLVDRGRRPDRRRRSGPTSTCSSGTCSATPTSTARWPSRRRRAAARRRRGPSHRHGPRHRHPRGERPCSPPSIAPTRPDG